MVTGWYGYSVGAACYCCGIDIVSVLRRDIVLVWLRYAIGMVLLCCWYCIGMIVVWHWYGMGIGMVLVCYGIGIVLA